MGLLGYLACAQPGKQAKSPQVRCSLNGDEEVLDGNVDSCGNPVEHLRAWGGCATLPPGDPLSTGHADQPRQLMLREAGPDPGVPQRLSVYQQVGFHHGAPYWPSGAGDQSGRANPTPPVQAEATSRAAITTAVAVARLPAGRDPASTCF